MTGSIAGNRNDKQYRNRQTHYLAVHITSVFEKGENIIMGKN